MALLERVSSLLRANLNDLLDKAEDPERLSKQILLDMENQLLQLKTQVAFAIADQHRLQKLRKEQEESREQWRRKAEFAVSKGQDDLARAALERSLSHTRLAEGYAQQHAEQLAEAETLRNAYTKLQAKLTETKGRIDLLLAQHRRQRALAKSHPAQPLAEAAQRSAGLARLEASVSSGARSAGIRQTLQLIANGDTVEDRFQTLEQEDQVEALLLELKEQQPRLARRSSAQP